MKKALTPEKAKIMLHDGKIRGHAITDKQRKYFGAVASGYVENGGWLEKYNDGGPVQPNYNDSKTILPEGFVGEGYISENWKSPAWGGQFYNGGEIMNVASIENPIAQNGEIIHDNNGYWNPDNYFKPVQIDSNKITMKDTGNVPHGVRGISLSTGETIDMKKGKEYTFDKGPVLELPIAKFGIREYKQLTDWGNSPIAKNGKWLNKYTEGIPVAQNGYIVPRIQQDNTNIRRPINTWQLDELSRKKALQDAQYKSVIKADPRSSGEISSQYETNSAYNEQVNSPSFGNQIADMFKLPSMYLADPTLIATPGRTNELLREQRAVQLSPYISNEEKTAASMNEAVENAGWGMLNLSTLGSPSNLSKNIANRIVDRGIGAINPFYRTINPEMMYKSLNANQAANILKRGEVYKTIPEKEYGKYIEVYNDDGTTSLVYRHLPFNTKDVYKPSKAFIKGKKGYMPVPIEYAALAKRQDKIYVLNKGIVNSQEKYVPYTTYMDKLQGKKFTASPNVQFTKGRVEKAYEPAQGKSPFPFTRTTPNYVLEADPTKLGFIKTKQGRIDNSFEPILYPGERGIPDAARTNEFLPFYDESIPYNEQPVTMLKKDPFWGYRQVKDDLTLSQGPIKDLGNKIVDIVSSTKKELIDVKNSVNATLENVSLPENNYLAAINPRAADIVRKDWGEQSALSNKLDTEIRDLEREKFKKINKRNDAVTKFLGPRYKSIGNIESKLYDRQEAERRLSEYSDLYHAEDNKIVGEAGNPFSKTVNTGKSYIVDFTTGKQVPAEVSLPGGQAEYSLDKTGNISKTNIKGTKDVSVNPEYPQADKNNIKYIEERFPGAKVFGSARAVADSNYPHLIHDMDVTITEKNYNKYVKDKIDLVNEYTRTDGSVLHTHTINKKYGEKGYIDFNVIEEGSDGKATGIRAKELFRQMYPDEYYNAARDAASKNIPLKIPYTPDELMENLNPTVKTVLDAYESPKPQHLNKIDVHISYGDPDIVLNAQDKYIKEKVGSRGTLGHQFPEEAFNDETANRKLLREIDFVGDEDAIVVDPKKMQVTLNDFYINNTVLSRGVNPQYSSLYGKKPDIEIAEDALTIYDPEQEGGKAMGGGQNWTLAGETGFGSGGYYGNRQVGVQYSTDSPLQYVDDIKRQVRGDYPYSKEEASAINKMLMDQGHTFTVTTPIGLIKKMAYEKDVKEVLEKVADITGRKVVAYDTFGNSVYSSTLKDYDKTMDAMEFALKTDMLVPKSALERKLALRNQGNSLPINSYQFKKIYSSLTGGLERLKQRNAALKSLLDENHAHLQSLRDRYTYNTPEIQKLEDKIKDIRSNMFDAYQSIDATYNRMKRLERIQDKYKMAGTIVGTTALAIGGLYGLTKVLPESKSGRLHRERKPIEIPYPPDIEKHLTDPNFKTGGWLNKYE